MESLGENLKILRKREHVSQKVLADYLNVAQNTIANYENNKRFPDKSILNRIATYFNISLDRLVGRIPLEVNTAIHLNSGDYEILNEKLIDFILEGKEEEAIQLVLESGKDNESIFLLFEQVLSKTMVEIGLRWHQGHLNVSWEHYATGVIDKILVLLSAKLVAQIPNQQVAICMSYSSDPHTTGVKMISEYLKVKGFKSYYLGGNTTTDSLIEMIHQLDPKVLAISVTLNYHLDGLKNLIDRIHATCNCIHLKILVGGQAFDRTKDQWKQSKADGYATNLAALGKLIEDI